MLKYYSIFKFKLTFNKTKDTIMKYLNFKALIVVLLLSFCVAGNVFSHCEMPCGIYHDKARFDDFDENIETISKAVTEIKRLSAIKNPDVTVKNQLVRWIETKEHHASDIQEIATEYFLTQRVEMLQKEKKEKKKELTVYFIKLRLLHEIVVKASKCKQTVDLEKVRSLADSIEAFEKIYFSGMELKNGHKHGEKATHIHDHDKDDDDE